MDDLRIPKVGAWSVGKSSAVDFASGAGGLGGISERRVEQEMQKNGLSTGNSSQRGVSFGDLLEKAVENVNQDQIQADRAIQELATGRTKNVHEAMLAVERADVSLKFMMQVRNKILETYREVMRMQV